MKIWSKLLLYFVSITGFCLASVAIIVACSDEPDPYDYYTSFFHADVQGKKDFGPFYFTDYQFTYSNEEPGNEAAINATEWAEYLGPKVKAIDVEKIMYHLDSAGKERAYHFFEQDPPVADSLAKSSFLWSLKDPAHDAAKRYYQFAVMAEMLGNSNYNYWEPAPVDTLGLLQEAAKALNAATAESDSFLKLRYYYQAQKLNHYAGNFGEARNIYDQHIAESPSKSHVKGWALALKAGEERRMGDTVRAAYLFSKVFADYPERRLQAYRNYNYIDAPFDAVLRMARTPIEKANLYAIKGFSNPEIETTNLEQVYDEAPSSSMVGVLLVREINKLEQYYLTPLLSNNNDRFYSSAQTTKPQALQPPKSLNNLLLGASIVALLVGITILIIGLRKQNDNSSFKIGGSMLILLGGFCLAWLLTHKSTAPLEKDTLAQGSFFVNMPDSVKSKYDTHIEQLRSFCIKLTNERKYAEPQVATLANAYLYFMQNMPDKGLTELQDLKVEGISEKLNDQKQIIHLLLSAQRVKQYKAVDEASILPSLKWLDNKVIAGGKPKPYTYPPTPDINNQFAITQRNFYNYVLAPAYLRQGDTAKAALAMLNSNNNNMASTDWYISGNFPDFWYNYLHSAPIKQLIDWKKQRPTEEYLAFLSNSLNSLNTDSLNELLGTVALREHKYAEAAIAFQQIKNPKLINSNYNGENYYNSGEILQGDPFVVEIKDYPKHFKGKKYTKLSFAKKMADLESRIKSEPKNAEAYYQMANGLYNTSTYGNSWGLISYLWSSLDFGRKAMYYYDDDYVKALSAKTYYLKARELSTDTEFKAMCTFMAAKCEQKALEAPGYTDDYVEREKQYLKQLKQNKYFEDLKPYRSTAFYKKAVEECSYLADFISSN